MCLTDKVKFWVVPVLSANLHEARGYNRLAALARGEVLVFMQVREGTGRLAGGEVLSGNMWLQPPGCPCTGGEVLVFMQVREGAGRLAGGEVLSGKHA